MRPKPARPRAVERLVLSLGFAPAHSKGSHVYYKRADGRRTVIYFHPGDMSIGALRQIIKDLEITVEEFNKSI